MSWGGMAGPLSLLPVESPVPLGSPPAFPWAKGWRIDREQGQRAERTTHTPYTPYTQPSHPRHPQRDSVQKQPTGRHVGCSAALADAGVGTACTRRQYAAKAQQTTRFHTRVCACGFVGSKLFVMDGSEAMSVACAHNTCFTNFLFVPVEQTATSRALDISSTFGGK